MNLGVQERLGTNLQEMTGEGKAMNAVGREAPTQRLGRLTFEAGRVEAIGCPGKIQPQRSNVLLFRDRLSFPPVPVGLPADFPDQDPL